MDNKKRTRFGEKEIEVISRLFYEKKRIEEELFDVLTPDEQEKFNLDIALKRINKTMGNVK
jgi:hypothetical protein